MQHISRKRLTPKDASLSLAYSRCIQNFADSDSGNKSVKLNFSLCRYVSRRFFLSDAYILICMISRTLLYENSLQKYEKKQMLRLYGFEKTGNGLR